MKYEKFDLQKALNGAELITRNGIEVTQWFYFDALGKEESFPITAVINGNKENFTKEGKYYNYNSGSIYDLFIRPNVKEIWVNVYYNSITNRLSLGVEKSSEGEAKEILSNLSAFKYIKTIKITDEI